ncbi:protein L-Myc-1-A-like [Bombina bombina]|uniref:protein L-Myc-1-A-like n=1 Tax=Bombina bombina TaxID=8345 RepID=UPI00235AF54E|nr:protein L-Myc-1-A-like [Bombina bombina]
MDFGFNNHYFYDDDDLKEDYYRCIAPSEDIWKKFELVPGGQLSSGCSGSDITDWGTEWESPVKLSGFSSVVLLKYCMWSGFSTRERLEKVINERLSTAPNAHKTAPDFEQSASGTNTLQQNVPAVLTPAAVPEKVPHSSGSESTSDSDDEEDDDEIDVVTVGKRKSCHGRQPVTITVRADPLDTVTKLFHISIHQQQHNYAARLPPEPSPPSPKQPPHSPNEEESNEVSSPSLPCSLPVSSPSGGSDSDDLVKRKNHNYMECKRRNDLRSRFQELRDEVPGLSKTSKTPKVVVLSKATEYLEGLVSEEQRLLKEKMKLWSRHQQLLRRLSQLKDR